MTDIPRARRFGFGLVAGLSLLALSCWRRHRALPWPVPLALAALALGAAAVAPGLLLPLELAARNVGRRVARVNSAIVLTLAYYLIVTPAALAWRLFGGDPLELRARGDSYWRPVEPRTDASRYEKPF